MSTEHLLYKKKEGQTTRGHALVLLNSDGDWHRVLTAEDTIGWVKKNHVIDTMEFFQRTLDTYIRAPDHGIDGPRFFLGRAHYYMTNSQIAEIIEIMRTAANTDVKHVKKILSYIADCHSRGLKRGLKLKHTFERRAEEIRFEIQKSSSSADAQK